ncbi:MAG: di-heme oxidoredictase family protein [Vicinamibacterales bacterium]
MIRHQTLSLVLWTASAALAASPCASAQYAERPHLFGSAQKGVDVSGRSVKDPRVRAVHTTDPNLQGGTAYLIERDPFLGYQIGRNLNFLEFTEQHGVFDARVGNLAGPMPDGTTSKITANNQTSCLGCHNVPTGNPGGGPNFSKDSGNGRNSPHYFGAGVIEMMSQQLRSEMLAQVDSNGDGWVSASEAQAAPASCAVQPSAGAVPIDFGNPRLTNGATGRPQLNNIFRVWYLDAAGQIVPGATQVDGVATVGYGFEMVVWGWGQGVGRSALNPTNRAFLWDPFKTHSGLDSHDPSTRNDPDGDGVSAPTLAGAVQFPATHKSSDNGTNLDPLGFSRDDPDGDGYLTELSEGDLDLAEWFMLNAPRPAFAGPRPEYRAGVAAMNALGCTVCHVPDWALQPRDATHSGDRRFFDLNVGFNENTQRLEGKLVRLYTQQGANYVRNFSGTTIPAVFTDLKHHDMGDGFKEIDFGGTVNKTWRTPPLWGVGSGFPWGHDGRSLTLEDAILRHGGEAAASRAAWTAATPLTRSAVLTMLSKLVLYDIEDMPADIDGNGVISDQFFVAGMDTGRERFNAEWLFQVPVQIQGPVVNGNGITITSHAAVNRDAAYGRFLPLRQDTDGDAWPDVWDHAPTTVGWKDGVN